VTTAYVGLLAGRLSAEDVEAIAAKHAPAGLFTGHLVRGARELDEIAERAEA
jgi:hypothetical protein